MTQMSLFQKIRLETAQGEFVKTVIIPKFNELPHVILWGERLFKFCFTGYQDATIPVTYRECFAVAALIEEQE